MHLLGDVGHVESRFSPFGDSVSVECKIGARFHVRRTIGSEIILDTPDGTPREHGSCRISLLSFGDSVIVGAR